MKETMKPMFIKDGAEARRIVPEDVQVVMVEGKYSHVYGEDAKDPLVLGCSHSHLMSLPPFAHLVNINRGVAVNVNHIHKIKRSALVMNNGMEVYVSKNHVLELYASIAIYA